MPAAQAATVIVIIIVVAIIVAIVVVIIVVVIVVSAEAATDDYRHAIMWPVMPMAIEMAAAAKLVIAVAAEAAILPFFIFPFFIADLDNAV